MESVVFSISRFPHLHYRKAGKGPAIVLIHGFPEDGSLWEHILPALADSHTVLMPDTPGSGQSKLPSGVNTIEELATGIEAMLSKEGIEEAVIGGHSMGGYITLAFAEKHRAWLKGISLIHSIASADTEEKKENRKKAIEIIRKGGKETFVRQMVPNMFSARFKEQAELMQNQVERGLKLDGDTMIAYYEAMMNRKDRVDVLNDSKVPVQFIVGAEDSLIPVKVALSQCKVADTTHVSLYNNCGHMSMLEQPERLASDLKQFTSYCYNY
jgi:pimeloyl-ACP methyl ester carboxylesterase